jgi:tetratricopeptide (TPR) repeat protein
MAGACGIAIFLIVLLIYIPALNNSFVNWDDNVYVYENSRLDTLNLTFLYWMFTALYEANWHPLTWLSHAVDYALFGLTPFGHHLISIILHGINTFLVFLLVIQLMIRGQAMGHKAPSPPAVSLRHPARSLIAAATTALLFGIHPVHVESVAWVAERKDVLCAFFFLLTLCAYSVYATAADTRTRRAWFTGCLVLFAASLMAKPMAITLPLVLLLLDLYPLRRITLSPAAHRMNLSVLMEKVPFFLLSLVSGILTFMAQHAGGAVANMARMPLRFRLLNALHSLLFYVGKMIWPGELVPFYPFSSDITLLDPHYSVPGILAAVITAMSIWMLRRKRYVLFTAWAYYVITLLPVSGMIQVGSQAAADRYTYLPSVGIFLLAGIGVSQAGALLMRKKSMVLSGGLLAALLCSVLGYLTVKQIRVWHNSDTLWAHVARSFPGRVPMAHHNLGMAYEKRGMYEEAVSEYTKAIAIDPFFEDPHINLGTFYYARGLYERAAAEYEKAIAINPRSADAHYNLGLAYDRAGRYDKAVPAYEKAIAIDPQCAKAYNDLGFMYTMKGMYDKAVAACQKAISINPRFVQAYNNLGLIYHTQGMYDAAIESYEKALSLNPRYAEAHHNMGLSYFARGQHDKAIAAYERAIAINPDLAQTHNYLGMAYYAAGNYPMATMYLEKALALGYKVDPNVLESAKPNR